MRQTDADVNLVGAGQLLNSQHLTIDRAVHSDTYIICANMQFGVHCLDVAQGNRAVDYAAALVLTSRLTKE